MDMSSTSKDTGMTEAQAAERLFARYQSDEDNGDGETRGEEPQADEFEVDPEGEEPVDPEADPDADPEESDEGAEASQTFKVKVNGEEVEVPLDELLKGYSREQDYTRKTQAIAEERKAIQSEKQAAADVRDQYSSRLEAVEQIIQQTEPRVDQSLRQSNPAEWSAQMLQHKMWAEQRQAVQAEKSRLEQEREQEQARERAEMVKQEAERLKAAIPEWADPAVAKVETEKLREYGLTVGFTDDELDDVIDHRAVRVLRDAMAYRELKAKSQTTRAAVEATKVTSPGPKTAPSRATEERHARARLADSGSTDAAAQLILMKTRRA